MRARYVQARHAVTTASSPANSILAKVRSQPSVAADASPGQRVRIFRLANTDGTSIAAATLAPATMKPPSAARGMMMASAISSGSARR